MLFVLAVNVHQLRDGRLLSGGMDRMMYLWDIRTGLQLCEFRGHLDSVFCVGELPDGRLCSGSADCTVRIWSRFARSGRLGHCERVISGHSDSVQYLVSRNNMS